jgi:transcriptional regulator GlxA family with amidase domain
MNRVMVSSDSDEVVPERPGPEQSSYKSRRGGACQILRTGVKTRTTTPMAYAEWVNLAIDHVVGHLGEPLRLADVARAARLSPFHFHRVFQVLVGETLAEFVKRLRLERALVMMAHAPRSSLTTIALKCGFSSSSDFSRCFKQRYGTASSAFDIKWWREGQRRLNQSDSAKLIEVLATRTCTRPEISRECLERPARTV